MNRNMLRRIEIVWPVTDAAQRQRIVEECLLAYLHDGVDAWDLQPGGTYARVKPLTHAATHGAQQALMRRYGGREARERG